MYQTWVPIHGRTLSYDNREIYLSQLRAADVANIVIVAFEMEREGAYEALSDHIAFYRENGVEAGIWLGTTIGHGSNPMIGAIPPPKYPTLVRLDGAKLPGTRCPLSPEFRRDFSRYCADLARTGAKTLLLDDDFRLSRRDGGGVYCTCDAHLGEISRLVGEPVSREMLRELAFAGEENKYRTAFLKAAGDSLRLLARDIRAAVDEVDPSVRVALCGAHSLWDLDGVDGLELTQILAGKNPPLLRLHGAPYWPTLSTSKNLPTVFEIARMFASFSDDGRTTLLAEGDVFPRPRYNVPASHLELFDSVIRADGAHHGILKYMVNYSASAEHDLGYLEAHEYDLPLLKKASELFSGRTPFGVRVHVAPHRLKNADAALSPPSDQSPFPAAGVILQEAGIPTVYRGKGFADAAFGEEGRYVDLSACENGLFLDAVSAIYLTRRGVDVGLMDEGTLTMKRLSALVTRDPRNHNLLLSAEARVLSANLRENAEVLLYAVSGEEELPLVYRYENASGQRFLITLHAGDCFRNTIPLQKAFLYTEAIRAGVEFMTGRPLPVGLPAGPGIYSLVSVGDGSLSILLLNCTADRVLFPRVTLDREIRSVEGFGCTGHAEGTAVVLDAPLPAYAFVLLEVRV